MKRTKNWLRITALMICCTMLFFAFACKPDEEQNSDVIYIEASLVGNGTQWLEGVADRYYEKTGVEVKINWDSNLATRMTELDTSKNLSDIYYPNINGGTRLYVWNLEGKIEPLDDVFSRPYGDSGKTIADVIDPELKDAGVYDGVRCAVYLGGGFDCLVYNPDILEKAGWTKEFPRTVDELIEMFEMIENANLTVKAGDKDIKVKPFVYSGRYSQISHIFDAMEIQYGGVEAWNDFFKYSDTSKRPDDSHFDKKSTRVAFDNLKKIMAVEDGVPKYVLEGSKGMSHTEAQQAFLSGWAAVCTTGTWFQTEMKEVINSKEQGFYKYKIAPYPLAADENGSFGEAGKAENLIDPNDEVVPSNMKHYAVQTYDGAPFFIPKKATNKEGAKDFLAFMLQEENLRYMHEHLGTPLRYDYNQENLELDAWETEIATHISSIKFGTKGSQSPIYLSGALSDYRTNVWTGIASVANYDYVKNAIKQRITDVENGWENKMLQI